MYLYVMINVSLVGVIGIRIMFWSWRYKTNGNVSWLCIYVILVDIEMVGLESNCADPVAVKCMLYQHVSRRDTSESRRDLRTEGFCASRASSFASRDFVFEWVASRLWSIASRSFTL